jgi:hypothetical protein
MSRILSASLFRLLEVGLATTVVWLTIFLGQYLFR